jgi:dCTP deaminase
VGKSSVNGRAAWIYGGCGACDFWNIGQTAGGGWADHSPPAWDNSRPVGPTAPSRGALAARRIAFAPISPWPLPTPTPAPPRMSIMSDRWITRMATEHGMIEPFEGRQVRQGVISYGVSSYGYDMRVAREFRIFTNVMNQIVDPKAFDDRCFVEVETDVCIVPPNSFALARSVEYFRIPRNVLTVTVGKSTYARCGIITNVTPFEPEWEGYVTLEISNTTPLPAKIYANEGIAQVLFFEGKEEPEISYKDKKGKYQGQHGVTLPRL